MREKPRQNSPIVGNNNYRLCGLSPRIVLSFLFLLVLIYGIVILSIGTNQDSKDFNKISIGSGLLSLLTSIFGFGILIWQKSKNFKFGLAIIMAFQVINIILGIVIFSNITNFALQAGQQFTKEYSLQLQNLQFQQAGNILRVEDVMERMKSNATNIATSNVVFNVLAGAVITQRMLEFEKWLKSMGK